MAETFGIRLNDPARTILPFIKVELPHQVAYIGLIKKILDQAELARRALLETSRRMQYFSTMMPIPKRTLLCVRV